jgi:hypothetical protein
LVGVVFLLLIALYILTPWASILWGERVIVFALIIQIICLIGGAIVSSVPSFGSWPLDGLLLMLLVHMDETWDRLVAKWHYNRFTKSIVSLQKVLLFHIQATVLLNLDFWASWRTARWVFFAFEFVNLTLRGFLPCNTLLAELGGTIWAPVVLLLVVPLGLFIAVAFTIWIQHLFYDCARRSKTIKKDENHIQHEDDQSHSAQLTLQDHLLNVFLRILYQAYFEVCVIIFGSLRCMNDNIAKKSFSVLYPWMECNISAMIPVAVPFFVLYVIGIPVLFILLLRHYKKDPHVQYWLGFFHENYRVGMTYYEISTFVLRALLAASLVLSGPLVSVGVICILLVTMGLQFILQPYAVEENMWNNNDFDGRLNLASLAVILLTHSQISVISLLLELGSLHNAEVLALTSLVSIINGVFFVLACIFLIRCIFMLWKSVPEKKVLLIENEVLINVAEEDE